LSIVTEWGSTQAERLRRYPCDSLVAADQELFRAVSVNASTRVVYRWLCQLRAAPYSYDWIDNFGRRSPRQLIHGLDDLAEGQRVMTIFELACFERDRHFTIRLKDRTSLRLFGQVAVTYWLDGNAAGNTRLIAKLAIRNPVGRPAALNWMLALGDFIMMRKQLLTLRLLCESANQK